MRRRVFWEMEKKNFEEQVELQRRKNKKKRAWGQRHGNLRKKEQYERVCEQGWPYPLGNGYPILPDPIILGNTQFLMGRR